MGCAAERGPSLGLDLAERVTTALFVLTGKVLLNGEESAGEADLAMFDRQGEAIAVEAHENATILVLNGAPIDEPVASYCFADRPKSIVA